MMHKMMGVVLAVVLVGASGYFAYEDSRKLNTLTCTGCIAMEPKAITPVTP